MKKAFILSMSSAAALLLPVALAFAQDYQFLAPLPGLSGNLNTGGLSTYLQDVFNLGLGIAVALSVVMIVVGGAQYLSTDAVTGKSAGKERVTNALIGLVLALGAYLILYTINPDLLKLNLSIENLTQSKSSAGVETVPATGVVTTTEGGAATSVDSRLAQILRDEASIRAMLKDRNIDINKAACTEYNQKDCTTVGGLPLPLSIDRLTDIKNHCNCSVMITGGTEYWLHTPSTRHGPGNAVVDLRSNDELNSYLGVAPVSGATASKDGALFRFEATGDSDGYATAAHWHVVLNYR